MSLSSTTPVVVSSSDTAPSEASKVPGWEEALTELVSADRVFVTSASSESDVDYISAIQSALFKIHSILGSVAHSLHVPEQLGRDIISLTEGWENLWVDYDLLSAVHSAPSWTPGAHATVFLDAELSKSIDISPDTVLDLEAVPQALVPTVCARRRLLKAATSESARLVLICARITAVDVLLRQPKRSPMFLSSYFQSFPSFICQTASVANLMANRAVTPTVLANSIEAMIAFSAMSLLATVVSETNHVTQALSVLSANNPHAGILANLMTLTLSASSLQHGLETYPLSKSSVYLLMSGIQNAKHPGSVANSTMLRKVLDVLVSPDAHPEVTHACCVCLEVALEFSHTSFSILFRDLDALDQLIDRGLVLLKMITDHPQQPKSSSAPEGKEVTMKSEQKALSSIFSLLRFSFQSQEIHVGINLHEKLSAPDSALRRLLVDVVRLGVAKVVGNGPFNNCVTLIGNVTADDPTIISTFADCGIVAELASASSAITASSPPDDSDCEVASALFVALCTLQLHDTGIAKLKESGDPLKHLMVRLISDELLCSGISADSRMRNIVDGDSGPRPIDDIGTIIGQSCDDVIRNRPDMKAPLVLAAVEGLRALAAAAATAELPLSKRVIPGLRALYQGLLSTSDLVEHFIDQNGIEVLLQILQAMGNDDAAAILRPGVSGRNHPFLNVFKMIGQRCGRVNAHCWQQPLVSLLGELLGDGSGYQVGMIGAICGLLSAAMGPAGPTPHMLSPDGISGAMLVGAGHISRLLPRLLDDSSTHPACWTAVKNFVTNLVKLCNTVHTGSTLPLGTETLANILTRGLGALVTHGGNADVLTTGKVGEVIDLLTRSLVEEKNHSLRPVMVYCFFRNGGIEAATKLFKEIVDVAGAEDGTKFVQPIEGLLVLFERLTSVKRLTNSPITNVVKTKIAGFDVDALSGSVTTEIVETVLRIQHVVHDIEGLTLTSAIAVVKIFSHAIMMQVNGASAEDPSAGGEESTSPLAKKARASDRAERAVRRSAPLVDWSELVKVKADDLTNPIVEKFEASLLYRPDDHPSDHRGVHGEFRSVGERLRISKSVALEFVSACLKFGDKGGCEASVAELIHRHTDYLGVSIVGQSEKKKTKAEAEMTNVEYVWSVVLDNIGWSRTANAIAGMRIGNDVFKEGHPAMQYLGSMIRILLEKTSTEESRVEAVKDKRDWLGTLLAALQPAVDIGIFGNGHISPDLQNELIVRITALLQTVAHTDVSPVSAKTVSHACLALLLSMFRRKENLHHYPQVLPVLVSLPAKVRTVHTAPMLTEIMLCLSSSELAIASKIGQVIDHTFRPGRFVPLSEFLTNQGIVTATVRDMSILEKLVKQVMTTGVDEKDSSATIARAVGKKYDWTTFDSSAVSVGEVVEILINFIVSAIPLASPVTLTGLSDLVTPTKAEEDTYPFALTVESALIMISAVLGEIATVRPIVGSADALLPVHSKAVERLVREVGRAIVEQFSGSTADAAKGVVGIDERMYKLVKTWTDGVMNSSAWMTGEVVSMVRDELAETQAELDSTPVDQIALDNTVSLRSYAYGGLVYWLLSKCDLELKDIESLAPLVSRRFSRASELKMLCRSDTYFQAESLMVALYGLFHQQRWYAIERHDEDHSGDDGPDDGEEADVDSDVSDDEGELEEGDDDGEEMDEGDMEEDVEEGDDDMSSEGSSVSSANMSEEVRRALQSQLDGDDVHWRGDDGEDDSGNGESEDDEGEEGDSSGSSGGSSMSEGDDEDDGFDDEEDDWDDYDVDWEEDDDEDGDEEDDFGDDDGMGDMIDTDIAEYMLGRDSTEIDDLAGGATSVPQGSPLVGPEPVPQVGVTSCPFPVATTEAARKYFEESVLPTIAVSQPEVAKGKSSRVPEAGHEPMSDEDMVDESGEEEGEEEASGEEEDGGDWRNMTADQQLAGLEHLSPEERLSIQQALALEDDEEDDGSDAEFGSEFEHMLQDLPPNVRVSRSGEGPLAEAAGGLRMLLEVPPNADADMITEAITQMGSGSGIAIRHNHSVPMMTSSSGGGKKSSGSKGEFALDDPLLAAEDAERLSPDYPGCERRVQATMSPELAASLSKAGMCMSRYLMLRNQVPLRQVTDRVLIGLCVDIRVRTAVLENLFGTLLKFVVVSNSAWTLVNGAAVDSAMPPMTGVYDSGLNSLLPTSALAADVNAPGQCRSVGAGRLINSMKLIVNHVPRARLWFSQPVVLEDVSNAAQFVRESAPTPEKLSRRRSVSTPVHESKTGGINYTSSDGEGPLVRGASSASAVGGIKRKVSPISVLVRLLTTPFVQASPSHSLIIVSLILEALQPFPSTSIDRSECDSQTRRAVPEDAIQGLCEFLVENKSRLRHMPEFDKAVSKVGVVLVTLCQDSQVKLIVKEKLQVTGSRLVSEMLTRLNADEKASGFSAAPLVRLFKTAKQAFANSPKPKQRTPPNGGASEEVPASVSSGGLFVDFASSLTGIDALWTAIDVRLALHNNLLLGAPSVAQQALQRRRGDAQPVAEEEVVEERAASKIAALETISRLIPLVELFLAAHHEDVAAGAAPSATSAAVVEFVERHRRPINAMVKSRPSILSRAFAPLINICPHLLDFDNKRAFFRTKLRQQTDRVQQLKLTVRREDVFRDSYSKLQIRSKDDWRGKLNISFQGEEGVDAGGLVREWFGILAREIFNPNYALFTPASGRPSTFLINPASSVNPDHIHYFKFCGRFIGKAVFDNQRIDAYFVRSFYKHMLGKTVTWRDMEATDPDYFKNLNWILENDMTDVDYYSFTVEQNEFGKLKVVELIPGGEDVRVTEENKHEYVRLVCEHKLTAGIQEQLKAFLQGFHELVPEQLVGSLFDDKELEMLISGLPSIDLEDLKRNTDYVHYVSDSEQIQWFWRALETFTKDELAWFLQFVTGSTQVPLEGFKGLQGMHGPQRFSIHRIRVEDRLPTAHTCFNQLDLPEYTSYEILETKLKQAVREGHSGFGFI